MRIHDYSDFHVLSACEPRRSANLKFAERIDAVELFHGRLHVDRPLELCLYSGRIRGHRLGTTWGLLDIYSQAMVDILLENGFSGWQPFPVVIYDRKGLVVPGYCGISITGKGNPIERERSETVIISPRGRSTIARKGIKGIFLKDDEYDGSHIFAPKGTSVIVVKPIVRDALLRGGISLVFEPMSEYTR